jgi:hypothetical protein
VGRILHILALIALVLSPPAMHGAEAAASSAHHASVAVDCHGKPQRPDDRERGSSADCAIACSAMPCAAAAFASGDPPRPAYSVVLMPVFAGTAPGSDPPPPRLS